MAPGIFSLSRWQAVLRHSRVLYTHITLGIRTTGATGRLALCTATARVVIWSHYVSCEYSPLQDARHQTARKQERKQPQRRHNLTLLATSRFEFFVSYIWRRLSMYVLVSGVIEETSHTLSVNDIIIIFFIRKAGCVYIRWSDDIS